MVNPSLHLPPLLSSLVNAEFNTATGEAETEKAYICVDCGGHEVIQLLNLRHNCYTKQDIESLGPDVLDVSGVCEYISNSTSVYFPKPIPTPRSSDESQNLRKDFGNCVTCGFGIKKPALFCSILCKLQWKEDQEREAEAAKKGLKGAEESGECSRTLSGLPVTKKAKKTVVERSERAVESSPALRMSTRSRKHNPNRAPLS